MERLAKTVEDVAHRRWLVSTNPDEHLEQLRPYLELGFQPLVFHARVRPGSLPEAYGEQILPRLRNRWGG